MEKGLGECHGSTQLEFEFSGFFEGCIWRMMKPYDDADVGQGLLHHPASWLLQHLLASLDDAAEAGDDGGVDINTETNAAHVRNYLPDVCKESKTEIFNVNIFR